MERDDDEFRLDVDWLVAIAAVVMLCIALMWA